MLIFFIPPAHGFCCSETEHKLFQYILGRIDNSESGDYEKNSLLFPDNIARGADLP